MRSTSNALPFSNRKMMRQFDRTVTARNPFRSPDSALTSVAGHRQECFLNRRRARRLNEITRCRVGEDLPTMKDDHPVGIRHFVAQMRRPKDGNLSLASHRQKEL